MKTTNLGGRRLCTKDFKGLITLPFRSCSFMPRQEAILESPCSGWMMTLTWLGEGKKEQSSALLSLLSHTYFSSCCCCILFLKVATRYHHHAIVERHLGIQQWAWYIGQEKVFTLSIPLILGQKYYM